MQYIKNIYYSIKKKIYPNNECDNVPIKENQLEITRENENQNKINDPFFILLFKFSYSLNMKEKLKNLDSLFKKYSYFIFLNLVFFYLNIFGIYTYIETLTGCDLELYQCLEMNIIDFASKLTTYMLYSIFIVGITITLSIRKYLSLLHLPFLFYKYLLLFKDDHYIELSKHGYYNIIFFIVGVIIVVILLNVFFIFKKNFLKGFHLTLFILMMFIFLIFYIIYNIFKNPSNCSKWGINLNNTYINKEKQSSECSIKIPNVCLMNTYFGLMDYTRFVNFDCPNFNFQNAHNLLYNYLNKSYDFSKTTKFGYPNSNNFDSEYINDSKHLNEIILNNIIDMNNITILNNLPKEQIPEISLEFWDNFSKGKIHINLNFNEKLSKERKLKENKNSVYKNILFIFINSISRVHFQRSLKQTSNFFKKYIKYPNKNKYTSYQFNKYHSLNRYTDRNIQPMFYGTEFKNDTGQNIIKYYKDNGYITCYAGEMCSKELYNIQNNKNLTYENYDHENIGMYCDPSNFDRKNPKALDKGQESVLRRCLYGRENYEYLLEYSQQFWEKYKNNRKFLRMAFIEGNEKTGEIIKYIDKPLSEFLYKFMNNGYLKDTALFLISDHGLNFGYYFKWKAEDILIERFLPVLIILLYDVHNNKKINLKETLINQNKFITAYDIYNTMYYIAKGKNDENEQSSNGNYLFDYIESKGRNCNKYPEISSYCQCI